MKKIEEEYDFIDLLKKYNLNCDDVSNIYINNDTIIVTGIPEENHNCDEMGCNSIEHIIYRGYLKFL